MEKEEEKQQPEVLFPEPRERGGGVARVLSISGALQVLIPGQPRLAVQFLESPEEHFPSNFLSPTNLSSPHPSPLLVTFVLGCPGLAIPHSF